MKSLLFYLLIYLSILSFKPLTAQRYLPSRQTGLQREAHARCLSSGNLNCKWDTIKYSGLAIDVNTYATFPVGSYYNSGRRAMGFGFGLGLEYQPFNKTPLTAVGNFAFLYSDIRNYTITIPVVTWTPFFEETTNFPAHINLKNNIANMNLGLRLWLPFRGIQPYVIAMTGFISSATVIKLYDESAFVLTGLKSNGVILHESIGNGAFGSRLFGGGISFNIEKYINIDLRGSLLSSKRFSYVPAENFDEWVFQYQQTFDNFDVADFESNQLNMYLVRKYTPLELFLFSFNVTCFIP